ncbi:CoA transferase [Sphingomonas lacunae]|uniref:CoA transferase n=1 Tax=Sphingomonas lacunae TaxID=2698828 RepID=A0A6M4AS64_9SPHN|nr:CoA transferase [Sphingomonas lacunae]QJQ31546.1 CoA transferase [Sphingomonas lacunae]
MIEAGDGQPLLSGVKVIDLTSVVFGPYATQILADMGADVIKVEPPAGDQFRPGTRPAVTPGMGSGWMAVNRGKRSVALDLKSADDLAVMQQLLAEADVFVVNVRGKAMERLGLDYAAVSAINPAIIYAHCVGFGQDGPYADLQAYDDVIQAASGTTTLLPRVDGVAKPRYLPSLIADKVSGLHAAYAIQAALIHKLRTGRGQHVEIPMFEAFTSFMMLEHLGDQTFVPPIGPAGYPRQLDPDRQPFRASDGWLSIVAYTNGAWDRIFAVLGEPEFLNDERFADAKLRFFNSAALYQRMAELTPRYTVDDLLARLQAVDIPAQKVRDLDEVIADEHLNATGFFRQRSHPSEGDYIEMRSPVRFSDANLPAVAMPPQLDQHGADLRQCGGK